MLFFFVTNLQRFWITLSKTQTFHPKIQSVATIYSFFKKNLDVIDI